MGRELGASRRCEAGMVTAEIAIGMLALVGVLVFALGTLFTAVQYFEVQDASREIAVMAARGRSVSELSSQGLPPGASMSVETMGERARVTVEKRATGVLAPFGITLRAENIVDLEPGALE